MQAESFRRILLESNLYEPKPATFSQHLRPYHTSRQHNGHLKMHSYSHGLDAVSHDLSEAVLYCSGLKSLSAFPKAVARTCAKLESMLGYKME